MRIDLDVLWVVWNEFKIQSPSHEIGQSEKFNRIFTQLIDQKTLSILNQKELPSGEDGSIELLDEDAMIIMDWFHAARKLQSYRWECTVFKPNIFQLKFVVIIKQDDSHTLATGRDEQGTYHRDIANRYYGAVSKSETMWVIGGGRIIVDPGKRTISFLDKSGDFGPFDHTIVAKLAREAMKKEGYGGWELCVTPSANILPFVK